MLRRLVSSSPPPPTSPELRQNPNRDPRRTGRWYRRCLYIRRDCTFLSLSRSSLHLATQAFPSPPFLPFSYMLRTIFFFFLCANRNGRLLMNCPGKKKQFPKGLNTCERRHPLLRATLIGYACRYYASCTATAPTSPKQLTNRDSTNPKH